MTDPFASVHLSAGASAEAESGATPVPREERAFSIAIFGDFSGRGGDSRVTSAGLPHLRPVLIDRDDFDDVLARMAPSVRLDFPDAEGRFVADFRELDDFHPDALWDRLPLFRELRELRDRLDDPATFRQAAAELRGGGSAAASTTPRSDSTPANLDGVLERVLDVFEPAAIEPRTTEVLVSDRDFRAYIGRIVAPHLVAGPDPRQAEMIAGVDAMTTGQMRAVLHHPAFQALESLWRGVFFLTRRLNTGTDLRLYLIDIARSELRAALSDDGPAGSTLRDILNRGPENGARGPWSLLVGAYSFGPGDADLDLLTELADVAAGAGAPWVSAGEPALVGCLSPDALGDPTRWGPVSPRWGALRQAPNARWLAMALPRILLRLPYGSDADECDRFRFEEAPPGGPGHDEYLWGNPALAVALLLGETFDRVGWDMRPDAPLEIDGLPLHLIRENGSTSSLPCAETWLPDAAVDAILGAGLMPFVSLRDGDSVRLARVQAVSDPPTRLAW